MTTPTLVVLAGRFTGPDSNPASGTVTFRASVASQSPTHDLLLPASTLVATLDAAGEFTVDLYATDDTDWAAPGWTWEVTERISGADHRVYNVEIAAASAPGPVQLADLSPAVTPVVVASYVLQAAYDAHVAGAATDAELAAVGDTTPYVVEHGATAATDRPVTGRVAIWVGTVEPTNALATDIWINNS